jgi:geranylgeranyl diphosphate synthase type II
MSSVTLTSLQPFEEALEQYLRSLPTDSLRTPIRYILELGGKRIRPALVLMASDAFGGSQTEAMHAALAVEVFHNFTLMHDDIMDCAPLRRGKSTVHEAWNTNAAILSGDAMLIEAYNLLCMLPHQVLPQALHAFNRTALEVCLGQQYDMDFETRSDVSLQEYIEMIGLKTAVLLGCSLKLGAIVAGAGAQQAELLYTFGKMAGIGFQIQDDLLDAFGDAALTGKQQGGDIIANKKTCLIIRALEKADANHRSHLEQLYFGRHAANPAEKVHQVLKLFTELGIDRETKELAGQYFAKAEQALDDLALDPAKKQPFREFLLMLGARKH